MMAALEKGRTMKGGAFHNYKVVVTGHSLGKILDLYYIIFIPSSQRRYVFENIEV